MLSCIACKGYVLVHYVHCVLMIIRSLDSSSTVLVSWYILVLAIFISNNYSYSNLPKMCFSACEITFH